MRIALQKTQWAALEPLEVATKSKLLCRCTCGIEKRVRVSDLISGGSLRCRVCADKDMDNGKAAPAAELRRRAQRGVEAQRNKRAKFWHPFTEQEVKQVYSAMNGASSRCNNPNNQVFKNYGGRGIQFAFPSPTDATRWVLDNLGPKPSTAYSIDRIDNNRHYEPGNLRWATRQEQARNKRTYKRTERGEVIRRVLSVRQDLTYECVRNWLKQGFTEAEIINRSKYACPGI